MSESTHEYTHLEDFCEDIIAKAQNGLRITNRELADRAGIDLSQVKDLKSGEGSPAGTKAVAKVLGLHPERLETSRQKSWMPAPVDVPGLHLFVSEFRTMTVNAYLLDGENDTCILIDTGVDAAPILRHLRSARKQLGAILLTHAHPDHVAALPDLHREYPEAPVYIHPKEDFRDGESLEWSAKPTLCGHTLETLRTPGHSPGGTSFLIVDHTPPICFVGDALFAGSIGGCATDYEGALRANRDQLLSLPDETILCPGHGPITTAGEEKAHNPFFP